MDPDALLREVGSSEAELCDPAYRVPRSTTVGLLEAILSRSPSDVSGFTIASFVRPETFDLLEYGARSSATLRESLDVANRYACILDDSANFRFEPHKDTMIWRLDMVWPEHIHRYVHEYLLGILRAIGTRLLGEPVTVREILCAYPAPDDTEPYRNALNSPVRFNAHCNGYVFELEILERRPPGADHALAELLRRHADALLKKLGRAQTARDRVRRLLIERLPAGEPTSQQIAQHLGTTPSTLRRRLADEGSSYRALLREVRLELIQAYLGDPRLGVSEIGSLLGFADTSSFFKAFKNITGLTPSEYREQILRARGGPPDKT
jgi:AraC-like DNA-binding protein